MFKSIIVALFSAVLLSACASSPSDPAAKQKEQAELLAKCSRLMKEIEDLKGKPVRRNAAREYYKNECIN